MSPCNGSAYTVRFNNGIERSGIMRKDLIAEDDANYVGKRCKAKNAAGTQKRAATRTTTVNPVKERLVLLYSLGDEMYKWELGPSTTVQAPERLPSTPASAARPQPRPLETSSGKPP